MSLPIVYRDFRGNDLPNGHVDFQNANGQETGIVQAILGPAGKPVYAKAGVFSATTHGVVSFDQWFRDVSNVNLPVVSTLPLSRTSSPNALSYLFEDTTFFPLDGKGWVAEGQETTRPDSTGAPHTTASPARRVSGSCTRARGNSSSRETMTSGASSTGSSPSTWEEFTPA